MFIESRSRSWTTCSPRSDTDLAGVEQPQRRRSDMFVLGTVVFVLIVIVLLFFIWRKPPRKRDASTVKVPRPRYNTETSLRQSRREDPAQPRYRGPSADLLARMDAAGMNTTDEPWDDFDRKRRRREAREEIVRRKDTHHIEDGFSSPSPPDHTPASHLKHVDHGSFGGGDLHKGGSFGGESSHVGGSFGSDSGGGYTDSGSSGGDSSSGGGGGGD